MTAMDRRRWLAASGALLLAPAARAAEARVYDYLFLDLGAPPGAPPTRAFADHVRAAGLDKAGGTPLGLFSPQIGWHARQAALLVGWSPDANGRDAAMAALAKAPGVKSVERHRLQATARPSPTDRLKPGGIYVHRWFVIATPSLPEFIELSTTGWRDFEARFDTNIFGLFTAEQTAADKAAGQTRLLLLTRYKDHGVWEASRNPDTAAMAAFQRRQLITRDTWNDSTLLVPL
ncbi:hypothetical protein [Phenylobacterium sp.]|uniref:hypothetical protein n=1 Tax=Phenylobacterium sp. TaxID=1871053 RepID=UPI003D29D518